MQAGEQAVQRHLVGDHPTDHQHPVAVTLHCHVLEPPLEQWAELAHLAIDDAGLSPKDVDGICCTGIRESAMFAPSTIVEYLDRPVNFADAQYDAAVADLERALDERRNDLNPRTVEILERNLTLIDAAIAQARQALEEDPGNTYLNRHLVDSRRRKLELLRRATAITEGD